MISKYEKDFLGEPEEVKPRRSVRKIREAFGFAMGASSLGPILVAFSDFGIVSVLIGKDKAKLVADLQDRFPKVLLRANDSQAKAALPQVIAFIEKPDGQFDRPLDMRGTDFQRRIWQAVRKIPMGETSTYAEIARLAGKPRAVRAVGTTCTNNPFFMIIPCHRVLHSGTQEQGLAKGSQRKRAWVEREIKLAAAQRPKAKP